MNKQLVFLTIKEANKIPRGNKVWNNRQEIMTHYLGYFQKVRKEFFRDNDANEKRALNDFCHLCRVDLKLNWITYADFENNYDKFVKMIIK